MAYNAKNAKEKEGQLPKDTIFDGVIVRIDDGVVKQFVTSLDNWKGSPNQSAINVVVEVLDDGQKVNINQVFTYNEDNGVTVFAPNSNLSRFKKKYNALPEVGSQVKVQTGNDGYGKIKLD